MTSPAKPPPRRNVFARLLAVWRGLGPAAPLLVLASAGPLLGLFVLMATGKAWLPWFGDGWSSMAAFVVIGATIAAACLVPTHATSLLAGYLFGAWVGGLMGFLVVLLAASLGFAVFSRLVGERVMRGLATMPRAAFVYRAMLGRSFWRTTWLIALLRLSPLMPFAATNVLMASLRVRFGTFLCATMLGVTPRAVAVAFVGAELSELDLRAGGNLWMTIVAVVATLVLLAVVGRYARAALQREAVRFDDPAGADGGKAR